MPDYQVAAILGKRLVRDCVTTEYAARFHHLVALLKTGFAPEVVGISGAEGEAEEGEEYFHAACKKEGVGKQNVFLDTKAKNTIENIRNILAHIQGPARCRADHVQLTLVSCDYHVDRLEIVDGRTPAQSLLKQARELVGEVTLERSTYPYADKWRGQLYMIADQLTIMRVNVEGINQWNTEHVVPDNVDQFRKSLQAMSRLLASDEADNEQVRLQVGQELPWLYSCYFHLAALSAKSALGTHDRRFLHTIYPAMHEAITYINRSCDPDEPVRNKRARRPKRTAT